MSNAVWLADVLRDAGLTIHPLAGWETRGRRGGLDPKGYLFHHTVSSPTKSDTAQDRTLGIDGRRDLPAPLCNISTNRDGSVSIIAAGRANHAGTGVWNGVSGNKFFIGDEMKNLANGGKDMKVFEPWSAVQLESARRAATAILIHIGASADMLAGHREYATPPGRKKDPHTLDMNHERALVAALMTGTLRPTQEDDMWQYLTVGEKLVTHAWNQGWLEPKTQETLDFFIKAVRSGDIKDPTWPDFENFRVAVTNGIALSAGNTGLGDL